MTEITFPGAKIHDNIALSLLKWMKTSADNRDVLKIASKEILSLEISDDTAVRKKSQEYVNELLEMPMDSKTEKNLKLFKEKMQGNCPADIQFSSVAPANGTRVDDGEIDQLENDDQAQSDVDSSNKNDEDTEENSDLGVPDDLEKSARIENAEGDQPTGTPEDGRSESNDSIVESPVQTENVEPTMNKSKRVTTLIEANINAASPARERYNTSNEVGILWLNLRKHFHFSHQPFQDSIQDDTPPQQFVLVVDVHRVPANSEESISPSPTKMRKRTRQLLAVQQNSPDIQQAPTVGSFQFFCFVNSKKNPGNSFIVRVCRMTVPLICC